MTNTVRSFLVILDAENHWKSEPSVELGDDKSDLTPTFGGWKLIYKEKTK